jgi:endonuclease/exonuclease/phosphatase family metal-dependent hydrolase
VDFSIMLGDFNCTPNSSVHRYLLGEQSLFDCESKPHWNDLANSHAKLNGDIAPPTLDFSNNPRWGGKDTLQIPDRCDRILVMEKWNSEISLKDVSLFGQIVSPQTNLAPSDHYGVVAEIEFKK